MSRGIGTFVLLAGIMLVGCQADPADQKARSRAGDRAAAPARPAAQGPQAVLEIKGMACPFCTYNVERQLRRVPGVEDVSVDLESSRAVVTLSASDPPSERQLRAAVRESGFTVDRVEMP